jgi:hypothetical protein
MSFELSFSPEFFFAEGEPYDGGPEHGNRPTSVWGAICRALSDTKQRGRIAEVLGCEPEFVTPEAVLDQIREVNSCSNLTVPVEVWVDDGGWVTLRVWDSQP